MSRKKKQQIFENVLITGAGAKGKAVAKAPDGKILFVKGVVPGDIVDVKTTKRRKSYYESVPVALIKKSDIRTEPVCAHFDHCGGCQWQHMVYEKQLYYKQHEVTENLRRIGKIELPGVSPILASPEIFGYRNKMEFSFSPKRWLTPEEIVSDREIPSVPACGFHIAGLWDKILDIEHCHLQKEPSNAIRNFIKKTALASGISFYDPRTRKGNLRTLMIRNTTLGEWMVLLQFHHEEPAVYTLLEKTGNEFPGIDSLLYVFNSKGNDTLYDLDIKTYSGKDYITERLGNISYRIHAKSFFQTNSRQAENLYEKVKEYAALKGDEIVYDLYTGAGTIALYLAGSARKVVGVESVPQAIEDAHENARMNGIRNTVFVVGDMKDVFDEDFIRRYGKPDVVVTDPPRVGMHKKVVAQLLNLQPSKIIYVSCNSATQARDLEILKEKYRVSAMQPVDMFPHTYHVENVVLLERN